MLTQHSLRLVLTFHFSPAIRMLNTVVTDQSVHVYFHEAGVQVCYSWCATPCSVFYPTLRIQYNLELADPMGSHFETSCTLLGYACDTRTIDPHGLTYHNLVVWDSFYGPIDFSSL